MMTYGLYEQYEIGHAIYRQLRLSMFLHAAVIAYCICNQPGASTAQGMEIPNE